MKPHCVCILYSENSQGIPKQFFERTITQFRSSAISRIKKFKKLKDRVARLKGMLLLAECFKRYNLELELIEELKHNQFGKPYIRDFINFSLSYSGDYSVCAATTDRLDLGIDIEKMHAIEWSDFRSVIEDEVLGKMQFSVDPQRTFFDYWTALESAIKADGRGFNLDPKQIEIENGKAIIEKRTEWFLTPIEIDPSYRCHLATSVPNPDVAVSKVDFA
jgi:4'-phosphopantetheinyl transferase